MLKILLACVCIAAAQAQLEIDPPRFSRGCSLDDMEERVANYPTQHMFSAANARLCKFSYENSCFFGIFPSKLSPVVDYREAKSICEKYGANPANVYSAENYRQFAKYMRSEIAREERSISAWIGMKANPQLPAYFLSDGEPAPFVQWYSGCPKTGSAQSARTGMAVSISQWPQSPANGMCNYTPTGLKHGVICEITYE